MDSAIKRTSIAVAILLSAHSRLSQRENASLAWRWANFASVIVSAAAKIANYSSVNRERSLPVIPYLFL